MAPIWGTPEVPSFWPDMGPQNSLVSHTVGLYGAGGLKTVVLPDPCCRAGLSPAIKLCRSLPVRALFDCSRVEGARCKAQGATFPPSQGILWVVFSWVYETSVFGGPFWKRQLARNARLAGEDEAASRQPLDAWMEL